ncbi:MAG: PIN domain-containing protein [Nitrospirae bacterium]|nr:PIN domain-containing protein [Nitrospirota bacterium]
MTHRYTLDTSAIMAYFLGEKEAKEVSDILFRVKKGEASVYVCFMSFMEVLYRTWRLSGEDTGRRAYIMLRNLPVKEVREDEDLLLMASIIKATCPLSVADAWIVAAAQKTDSTLLHKDPELNNLKAVKTRRL